MTQQEIIQMTGKKHVKIFKLSQLGIEKKEIAKLLGTNYGHVYNTLKDYEKNKTKAEAANNL